ncbi:DNRLRE domain-containing protein [Streptosporangium amethystogenes subsp. fukuiense]|uniref:DNRLRE domain-containing protein n=1 Tax=Streptosporangium amethystogenes subsp. fukuiense TaxID=698418 RepID=A0ABW2SY83_9ACTN
MVISLAAVPSWAQEPTPPPTQSPAETRSPQPSGTSSGDKVLDAAKSKAARSGKRVEIPERNTETTTVYANPDGKTVRVELSTEPVRVKKANGEGFTPIDTTLVQQDGVIKPKAIKGDLTLSAGADTVLLKSKTAQDTTEIEAPGGKLPKPTLKGNTATYRSAYGKGRDLVVTANATGFQQQITIAERPTGPVSFRVPFDLPKGMSFGKNAAGRPTIMGKDGKTLTEVRPTLLRDAKAADTGAPLDAGKTGKAAVTLAEDGKTLVFTPDAAFLADAATTYPVTMTAAASDWYEGHTGGGMDAYINDVDLTDSWDTFADSEIVVGKSYASNIAKRWRGYLKFPNIPAEFAGSTVQNADLHLWNHLSNTCGTSVGSGITARRITSAWDDMLLYWNSQPSVTSAGADTEYGAYSEDCNYAWNLTHSLNGIAQAWIDGATNYGIQLTTGNESELRNWRRYASEDAGGCRTTPLEDCKFELHPPILTVDVELPSPPLLDDVFMFTDTQLTTMPEYEEALAMSGYVPEEPEPVNVTEQLADKIAGQRDGQANVVGTDDLPPIEVDPGDDTEGIIPVVTGVEPADGAKDVPLDASIKVTFSEAVADDSVTVKDASGTQVVGTSVYDDTRTVLTFTPAQALKPGTTYTAEVSEASNSWEIPISPYSWSFTTLIQSAGHWTFDEGDGRTAADSSGKRHDATLNDTATWIAGKSGNAVSNVPSQARIAASQAAATQGKTVEVADETTATSITYAQPDGRTYKTEVTAGPVRTRQGGGWVPIDTTLVEQGGKLRPKTLAEGALVELSAGGTDPFVKMSADGKSYALRWPTPLPKPTVKGSVATYTDAAGVGADLVVTALPAGFRHEVVLRQRPSKPLELRIGVEDDGLTLTEGKGGRLLLKGKDKKLVAAGTRPIVSDGSGKGRPASAKRGQAGTDLVTKNGRTELVVKPDQTFLADAGTTYPVRVAAAVTLPLGADIEVSTYDTVDSPAFPDNQYLTAGTMTDGFKARVHLRFDTTGLQGSTVTAATLSMNTIDAHNCGAALANGIQVARLTGAWDPDNLYWANKPAHSTEDASTNFKGVTSDCATYPDSMDWNVTGIAQDWAAGAADYGLVLKSPGETNINNYRVFTSSEDTDFNLPPKLTITTSGPASQPTVSAPAITPAQTVNGTTVTTSLTPQLAATVADTASGNLTGQFEVEHDPAATGQGSGQIWTGASQTVTSGGQATINIPVGTLTDGWKIRWRARAANAAASTTSPWSAWQTATVDVPNPTVGAFQVTPSQMVDGITTATSLTPALRATVTDPAAQPVRAEFELEHDPAATGQGTGQIWAGAVDNVASGTQASATVSDGKLTDGWKVRWRVRALNTVSSPWSDWQNLTIDVPDAVSEPAVGALQVSPSEQVDGVTVTPTRTPALLAQVSDPAGKPLRAEAEIEHDPAAPSGQGSGQIWAGSADNVPAGTQATITVPADKLADGWKVRWRARTVSATATSAWSDWQSFTVSLPKPTATDLTITPSKVVDGVTVTTTLTPTLQATLTHPTGQALRAEAEIEHDPAAPQGQGTGQIWTGTVDGVASGTQASIAVPADKLTDGWKIRWRLRAVAGDAASAWSDWRQVTVDVTQPGEEPLAQTSGPVIRTDQSFTAAAWLRWSDKDGDYTVLEQKGTHQAPFRLGNTPDHGLVFTFTSADAADATVEGVLSEVEPPVDEWFHLAGAYDAAAKTASLYLNGTLIKTDPVGFATWNADTAMSLGSKVKGGLDDVQVYQRPLAANDVAALIARTNGQTAQNVNSPSRPVQAAAPTANSAAQFDYDHLNLEDCLQTPKHPTIDYARIQERPFSSCWTTWVSMGTYEATEDGDGPDGKRWVKASNKVGTSKSGGRAGILASILEMAEEDTLDHPSEIFFQFRATWVLNSYVGNKAGTEVANAEGSGLKPQNMKLFVRLTDFALYWNGKRYPLDERTSTEIQGLQLTFEAQTESANLTPCRSVTGSTTKTIKQWEETSSAMFLLESNPIAGGSNAICTIKPTLTRFHNNRSDLPLWSYEIVGTAGKRLGVARHGYARLPGDLSTLAAPYYRCDRDKVINHTGGCVNDRAHRVFEMSESKNPEFAEVTRHIKAALDPSINGLTSPPLRPGHDWSKPEYPPSKYWTGSEQPKTIPGNWNVASSPPLHKRPAGTTSFNRNFFSNLEMYMDVGTGTPMHWSKTPITNYCKYYFRDQYPKAENNEGMPWSGGRTRDTRLECDEYPFASTYQGAAGNGRGTGHYSIRAVNGGHNERHGNALKAFYDKYHVATHHAFWVSIVP